MSRRSTSRSKSKEDKAQPVGIKFRTLDNDANIKAATLQMGSVQGKAAVETKVEPVAVPKVSPEPAPPVQPPTAVLQPAATPAAVSAPEPVVKTAETPEPVVKTEPEPVVKTEPEPVVETEPEPVVKTEPEPVVKTEPDIEPNVETEADVSSDPGAAVISEPAVSSEPAVLSEPALSSEPAVISEPAVSSEPAVIQTEPDVTPEAVDTADEKESLLATSAVASEDLVESVVCGEDDLKDGEMREVDVGDGKALLVKDKGEFHAIGAKCTHFGAPLVKGVLCNGHVRCPWHGACFNIKSGDIEDFPGLDSVPKFEVQVSDGQVKVRANPKALSNHKRTKTMSKLSALTDQTVTVIVGGGPAALACAETLRQEDYKGQIIIITKDRHLPYDRTILSKKMNATADDAKLRDADFFRVHDIEVQFEKEVTSIDTAANSIDLSDGSSITYNKLLLATGTVARNLLSTPGHDLENVRTLRTVDDASYIAGNTADKNVVIIGTSFIGVETAAYLSKTAKSVTIVDLVEAPFQLALGKEVGAGVKKLLQDNGIKFYFKNSAKEFVGENGKIKEVVLQDDTRLEADFCVIGIGVVPATDFLKTSSLEITDRGFVRVDKQMRTIGQSNVFAAGDITHFPLFMAGDDQVNIQHWQMAHQQGRIAALNMLDKDVDIKSVPFFWTMLFFKSIRYTGYGFGYDDIIMHGDPEELKFIAYYTKEDKVIAVASMNEDPIAAQAAEAFLSGLDLTKDTVKSSPTDWTAKL